jgi:hypothetical protein
VNSPVNCGKVRYFKPGVCLTLVLILTGCKSPARVKESGTTGRSSSQVAGSVAPPAPISSTHVAAQEKEVTYRNLSGHVRFVGSEACAQCHLNIYKKYMRTSHGQAATLPSDRPELRNLPAGGTTICEQDSSHCFRVFKDGGEYYMSEFDRDPHGAELHKETEKIAYALGKPMAGTGYVIRRGNYLFEAPLSYYSGSQDMHPQGWGLSPGYDKDPLGFIRPLVGSCMYCHVGRPFVADDASNLYRKPPFGELKVGCENCHGPGGLHVDERMKLVPISDKIDTSIVSPTHLSSRLSDDICMYCHEFGEARIPQPGKKFEDFRPGTPLLNTMAIFKTHPIMGWNMMEWSDELAQSKCYRDSGGRLNCSSCHDGHFTPTAQEAPAFYRNKCLSCHQENSCREPLAKRQRTAPSDNCISCHMPKHVAPRFIMLGTQGTSHRIVAYQGEPLPAWSAHVESPDPATGLILVDNSSGSARTSVSPLVLLQAYQSVLARSPSRADLQSRYDLLLTRLAKSDPNRLVVLEALAKRELEKRSAQGNEAAAAYLSRAIQAGSRSPQDYMLFAELLFRSGQSMEAIKILKRAIVLFPYIPTPYENLTICYLTIGDSSSAKQIVKSGIGIFPGDPNLRALQSRVEALP